MKHRKHNLNPSFFESKEKDIVNKRIEKAIQPFYHSILLIMIMFMIYQFIYYDLVAFSLLLTFYVMSLILYKHIFHKQN